MTVSGQEARVVGRDLGRLAANGRLDDVVLAPGNRADLVVDLVEGRSELVATPVDRGRMMGGPMMGGGPASGGGGPVTLARLAVSAGGDGATSAIPPPSPLRDLRDVTVDGRRTVNFRTGMGGGMGSEGPMSFTFDGRKFDVDRIDQEVRLGTVEEWTIGNDSPMDHPFHLHVWPMQLVEEDGRPVRDPLWLDVVNVPARSRIKVRVAFEDFGGRTVYHCHVLDHEDRGMMGTIVAR